jgi:hypothetical protein
VRCSFHCRGHCRLSTEEQLGSRVSDPGEAAGSRILAEVAQPCQWDNTSQIGAESRCFLILRSSTRSLRKRRREFSVFPNREVSSILGGPFHMRSSYESKTIFFSQPSNHVSSARIGLFRLKFSPRVKWITAPVMGGKYPASSSSPGRDALN